MNVKLDYFEDIMRGCFREESQKYLSFFNGNCGRVVMVVTIPITLFQNIKDQYWYEYIVHLKNLTSERIVRYGFELNKDYIINIIRTE